MWCLCSAALLGKETPIPSTSSLEPFLRVRPKPSENISSRNLFSKLGEAPNFPTASLGLPYSQGLLFHLACARVGANFDSNQQEIFHILPLLIHAPSLGPTSRSCSVHISLDAKHSSHSQKKVEWCPSGHVPGTARPPHPASA